MENTTRAQVAKQRKFLELQIFVLGGKENEKKLGGDRKREREEKKGSKEGQNEKSNENPEAEGGVRTLEGPKKKTIRAKKMSEENI